MHTERGEGAPWNFLPLSKVFLSADFFLAQFTSETVRHLIIMTRNEQRNGISNEEKRRSVMSLSLIADV